MISQPSNQLGARRQYGRRLAGGCSLPLGECSSSISKHDFQGRVWCLASGGAEGGGGVSGGREQGSPEQPVSLLWQVIKFEMPTQCTPGAGVEEMSRNSQTLCSQVSWHPGEKYWPHCKTTGLETMIRVTLGACLLCVFCVAVSGSVFPSGQHWFVHPSFQQEREFCSLGSHCSIPKRTGAHPCSYLCCRRSVPNSIRWDGSAWLYTGFLHGQNVAKDVHFWKARTGLTLKPNPWWAGQKKKMLKLVEITKKLYQREEWLVRKGHCEADTYLLQMLSS